MIPSVFGDFILYKSELYTISLLSFVCVVFDGDPTIASLPATPPTDSATIPPTSPIETFAFAIFTDA